MRQESIEHLGQVKTAILETTGNISFYYYPDSEVSYGLPVLPKAYQKKNFDIKKKDIYACTYCGETSELNSGRYRCQRCDHEEWVNAINTTRLT